MPTVDQVRKSLEVVKDPELDLGILDLGLVYDISVEGENDEHVTVVMTLTSPMLTATDAGLLHATLTLKSIEAGGASPAANTAR